MRIFNFVLLILGFIYCTACSEKPSVDRNNNFPQRETTTTTEQTGFYDTYENTNRGIWQKPDLIIEYLGDTHGKTIADIGAGTGFLTRKLVDKVGKVIAIDIDPRFITYLDSIRTQEIPVELQDRLEPRLGKPDNPNLQPQEVDAVIIVNTYMYIENRIAYLKTLMEGMSDGSKLLIIDFKKKQTSIGPPQEIRTPLYKVEQELKEAGFEEVNTNDSVLDYQYIVVAKKPVREL